MDLPERIGRLQRRLAIAQRDLARKELGSQNYLKQKRKVARINERIADVRKAATHNATRELVNGYGTIAARQMGSKDMQQHGSAATKDLPRKVKKMLNRKMLDGNFAEFNRSSPTSRHGRTDRSSRCPATPPQPRCAADAVMRSLFSQGTCAPRGPARSAAQSTTARQTGRRTSWRPARTSSQSRSGPSSPRRRSPARRSVPSSHESKVG